MSRTWAVLMLTCWALLILAWTLPVDPELRVAMNVAAVGAALLGGVVLLARRRLATRR